MKVVRPASRKTESLSSLPPMQNSTLFALPNYAMHFGDTTRLKHLLPLGIPVQQVVAFLVHRLQRSLWLSLCNKVKLQR
jgi:hypothetical protein